MKITSNCDQLLPLQILKLRKTKKSTHLHIIWFYAGYRDDIEGVESVSDIVCTTRA